MLEGLIDRKVLDEDYEECIERLERCKALRQQNGDKPVYPNGSTAGLMLENLENAQHHIQNMIDCIKAKGR